MLLKSAALPIWEEISFATVAISLFKAANLALSKLIFLPNNSSAFNSFEIDCSKFNKASDEDAICCSR